jgi:hypothetical protein
MTLREAALAYRAAGLHPIPCEPQGKRSIVAWKEFQERQPTAEEINHWWSSWPDANVALVLGRGLIAIDIDSDEGRENLARAGVVLPEGAPISATGKGVHVFLSAVAGDRVALVPGVDIRGAGYVVAPPSVHASGRVYTWVLPLTGAPPAAPAALLALLAAPPTKVNAPGGDWFTTALAGVAEGGRDATCTRMAGYLLGKGVSVEATQAILLAWAERCAPPFPADQVTKCVESIAKREAYDAPNSLPPSAADLIEDTLKLITSPSQARSTGLGPLDALLEGGLEPGTFTLIGGTAGTGKTALMLQIATAVARAGQGVLFVTLEMGATRLLRRMLSQMSQVKFQHLKQGKLVDGERAALGVAADALRALPLWIETRVRTVEAVGAVLGEFDPGRIGLVCVDYAQKMTSPHGGDDLRHEVEHVSEQITKLAVSLNLAVVAASALSRPDSFSDKWRPTINNLRESAKLGHDADNVVLLYRARGAVVCEVMVEKQRDGATGAAVLGFRGDTLTFTESV